MELKTPKSLQVKGLYQSRLLRIVHVAFSFENTAVSATLGCLRQVSCARQKPQLPGLVARDEGTKIL